MVLLVYLDRHRQYRQIDKDKRCDVFILWKIIEVYKSIMSGLDVRIMELKIICCGEGV